MTTTFSLCIGHSPWKSERVEALREMFMALTPHAHSVPFFLNAADYRGTDWQVSKVKWALDGWRSALATDATHHVFMTDDLHIAPRFWEILGAMVEACRGGAIGLLSNHPKGPRLAREGHHWYRCGAWIVGPAYVLPHHVLVDFVEYFEALRPGNDGPGSQAYANDDSSLNEFLSRTNRFSYHPLPTIIEHRGDVESTVGHGDRYSRERVSWRQQQAPVNNATGGFTWVTQPWATHVPLDASLERMTRPEWWGAKGGPEEAPLLSVTEPEPE